MIDKIRHLLAFSDTPRYNIKAVVQQTQVNVSTLRAWEQRYGVPQPTRTEHGHRLYSQRDIEIIKWLKQATEDGIAISQAVVMLQADPEESIHDSSSPLPSQTQLHISDAGWPDLRRQLFDALVNTNLRQAHVLMNTAVTLFPTTTLVYDVILPILSDFDKRWVNETGCIADEQIAVQFIRQRLMSLLQIHAPFTNGPRVICGSTNSDFHDLGSLIYAVLMEQQGWEVLYLGPNLGLTGLTEFLMRQAPALVVLTASMAEHVVSIQQVGQMVVGLHHHGLHFAYAGRVFVAHPELRQRMPGMYLGDDFVTAIDQSNVISDENEMTPWASAHAPRNGVHGRTRLGLQ
jgi:MerR family transcriptional regulator, light-induced transcriptional regulator